MFELNFTVELCTFKVVFELSSGPFFLFVPLVIWRYISSFTLCKYRNELVLLSFANLVFVKL